MDIFDAALQEYATKTGIDLTTHPLATVLEECYSPEAVLEVLREQARVFDQYRNGNDSRKAQLMDLLNPTVNILHRISTSGTIRKVVGVVSR